METWRIVVFSVLCVSFRCLTCPNHTFVPQKQVQDGTGGWDATMQIKIVGELGVTGGWMRVDRRKTQARASRVSKDYPFTVTIQGVHSHRLRNRRFSKSVRSKNRRFSGVGRSDENKSPACSTFFASRPVSLELNSQFVVFPRPLVLASSSLLRAKNQIPQNLTETARPDRFPFGDSFVSKCPVSRTMPRQAP